MNRLWVRLSIIISSLIFIFTILPLLTFLVLPPRPPNELFNNSDATEPRPTIERRIFNPWRNLPENIVRAILIAGVAGVAGGVAASRLIASPITKLANTARAIGGGNLNARVQLKPNSKEIDELAFTFNKMAADLQHAAQLRNSMMADVSHELRTPLTVLEGNLRAALDHVYELDDEQIANLYVQTRHLIQLVNELRELALAEAAELPLNKQSFDLRQLAQETAAVFEPLAEEKGITLTAELPATPLTVEADRSRIRQVMHNLLANALRHTPAGGSIRILAQSNNGRMQLAVQDSGDGISIEQLEHVFERFYRTDPSRSRETGGSGLGLAIVRAIVEAHGGTVAATSAGPGKGSTFTIYFA